jgi:uncharacterized protein YbjQ (UPF0145 family)
MLSPSSLKTWTGQAGNTTHRLWHQSVQKEIKGWLQITSRDTMIVVNTETIPGREIVEVLGLVRGNTIRAKHIGKDIMAGLRNIVGGELTEYTEMISEAREEAINRMLEEAEKLRADAVVNVRLTTSQVATSAAEILAYGTAVRLK